jgi:type III pantothenate kinase
MKLLIDIGNTRVKWATCADGVFGKTGESVHRSASGTSPGAFLDAVEGEPESVLAANVAGRETGDAIAVAVRDRWNLDMDFAATQPAAGDIRNAYDDYTQMGVDRWLAILAARARYQQAACIVDAGTAVTIDQVDDGGGHLGGVIVPGLDLMRRSLLADTGDIERITGVRGKETLARRQVFGRSTGEAIEGGTLSAICCLIEQCVARLGNQYGDSVLVMTGGDAERIIRDLAVDADHRPLLVLEGLSIYEPD